MSRARVGICIRSVAVDAWRFRGFLVHWVPGDPCSPSDNGQASWGMHEHAVVFETVHDAMAAIIQLGDHEGLGRLEMLDNISLVPITSDKQLLARPVSDAPGARASARRARRAWRT